MNAKNIHKLEQAAQDLKVHLAPTLRTFFEGCLENGFTREESFTLTRDLFDIAVTTALPYINIDSNLDDMSND